MIEILFFLVVTVNSSITTIPVPFATEKACNMEAARINRSTSEGGMRSGYGYCIRVEAKKEQK